MGLISDLFERRSITLSNPEQWPQIMQLFGLKDSKTGVSVNESNAVNLTIVYACVRLLSDSLAMIPFQLFKETENGKEKAVNHPLYKLIAKQPNPQMSSYTFRKMMMTNLLLWGNAYAIIERDNGVISKLTPVASSNMRVVEDASGNVSYMYRGTTGNELPMKSEQILHIKNFSFDGKIGLSPISLAREAVGLGIALEEFGAVYFKNGTNLGGIAEHPNKLSPTAMQNLRESLQSKFEGVGNAHKMIVLEEGMKFQKIAIPANDAQFIESRKFQINEIARFFNVPPHMVGDLDRATFSNIEHQAIQYVTYSLLPWCYCWEQEVDKTLLSEKEQTKYFTKFNVNGLLRGDFVTRTQGYHLMIQDGVYSINDVRSLEDMNKIEDGDTHFFNGNMVPIDMAGTEPEQDENNDKQEEQMRSLIEHYQRFEKRFDDVEESIKLKGEGL